MRLYLAGCGGMLGTAVHTVLSQENEVRTTDLDPSEPWLGRLDFRDLGAYAADVKDFGPEMLLHIGAHTDLEFCERNADDAYATNTLAVENAIVIANALEIPLVYISTAGIFDGGKPVYDDWDGPNPMGVYARSKYMGELAVQARVARHFIFRAGWMMGGGPKKDKKFVGKITRQIRDGAKVLNIVDDKLGTPTYTIDFAKNLAAMIRTEYYGLYNMACEGNTSRLEVATEIVKLMGLNDEVAIKAVSSDFFAQEYFAARPPSECMRNYKLQLRGMDMMKNWRVALDEYLRADYAEFIKG